MAQKKWIDRKTFSKIPEVAEIPHLLEVQMGSFRNFLQRDIPADKRKSVGLQGVFEGIFPITDVHENYLLEFVKYELGAPRYSVRECRGRNMTYAVPLKATLRLIVKGTEGEESSVKDIIEQDVFLGELPVLTDKGTFIINGAERVIVSQLHRSPGVFFDETTHPNGKRLVSARIIPFRGSWLEFSMDVNDIMYVHIDSRRKLPATTLLRALGYSSNEQIIKLFYNTVEDNPNSKKVNIEGLVAAAPVIDQNTGEVIINAGDTFTAAHIEQLTELKKKSIEYIDFKIATDPGVMVKTFSKDGSTNEEEALYKLYNLVRPGDPPTLDSAKKLLEMMFFSPKRYDLGGVGRYMINSRLQLDVPEDCMVLDRIDFVSIIEYLLGLVNGIGHVDDIDHLGNRRARSIGELLATQFSVGLSRMARTIRERMSLKDAESITPHELVNARTVSAVIDTFFGSSQLSQFMDQTNPLAELTHKRRLSALGPGGLTRERAGFKVRDVHHTHYGRMCPIETPEGPNIGLIASLSTYARINAFGFLETPYRKVVKGNVTKEIDYLTADVEDLHIVAQANEPLNEKNRFVSDFIQARQRDDYPVVSINDVHYMDVSPKQLVSVAASLIPFLENDDANRALMGSNMQRQAVPLLVTETPRIGTGMESRAAVDSGACIVAKRNGEVVTVDASVVKIKPISRSRDTDDDLVEYDVYELEKFNRSNQDTCINHIPIVNKGDKIKTGDVIADGQATDMGELALGKNILVGFMPWRGYNFEDAIIVSEQLLASDTFTSVHVEQFELQVRDTKRGAEEITREIPNVSDEAVSHLDSRGIVHIGAEIEPGDILVGKVTPKGETELSPEERLLRAIFGEKAGDVRDASLKAPPGLNGIVIDTNVFSRKERTEESKKQEKSEISVLRKNYNQAINEIRNLRVEKFNKLLTGQTANTVRTISDNTVVYRSGYVYKEDSFVDLDIDDLIAEEGYCAEESINKRIESIILQAKGLMKSRENQLDNDIEKVIRGAELPPGVVQLAKVKVATKRKLSVGDKMAGRHGNKGVLAKIVPVEDMPFLEDGTPLDILLNPLGVPSRMNLGQVLETHLGWAAEKIGLHISTPVFDGASIEEIKEHLVEADLPKSGKVTVFDGRTSEPLKSKITVGVIYIMKLSHLVDNKIHARSIGPYSLVTQQPLGGKAQFGGQRFGEMEVWALEAYGAAYTLQELLTVKSDDVTGRSKVYEAIVKGENPPEPGIPESFNVLVKELQSLGLEVDLVEKD
ncbi:MAG: DNA-directed RNA polymerase subunit beta [candidate division Zixibacteria bacterium]|nr:DNA-directed RNA polymerase subunit beta [candidate division Zixibacteria bacterium]